MKTFWLGVYAWTQKKPLFFVLLIGITISSVLALKPDQTLLGWDNYSSYFRPDINIFRLFFATWREFRGLGVPSDAEVTEIGRLLFYGVSRIFFNENLLDQLHHVFALVVGGVMMYKLADLVIRTYDPDRKYVHQYDFFAFMAAFFYLFNLNTLSVFYFPMPMFVIRFYALPLLFYVFLKVLYEKHIPLWKKIGYGILIFMSTGAFIVPTVFITICITLGFLCITQQKFLKSFFIIAFFVVLNAYWILPFANYTIQKGSIVQRAPTFVAINESQLNKDSSYFSPLRQLTFYPQFFEMYFTPSETNQREYFHPLAEYVNKYPRAFGVITAFPLLYLLGGILMIILPKNRLRWAWIPGIMFTFIFLTLKEYSPVGIVYGFFASRIPFFEMIFRFGDTKFHPFIAFSGSIAAAYALVVLYGWGRRYIKKEYILSGFIVLFIIPTVFLYKEYITGNLIGFFMYSRIPDAYRSLAEDINKAPGYGRVLHLPMEETTQYYWRPYSWGYFGSAFFHYFINKPYIDRTFEPASMENAYVHTQITNLLGEIQSLPTPQAERERADRIYLFFQNIGVEHLIIDETISTNQQVRGYEAWGNVNVPNAQKVADLLLTYGYAKKKSTYEIDLQNFKTTGARFPYLSSKITGDTEHLSLYELQDIPDKVSSISEMRVMQEVSEDSLNRPQYERIEHYGEGKSGGSIIPFARGDGELVGDHSRVQYTVPLEHPMQGKYMLSFAEQTEEQSLIEFAIRNNGQEYSLVLYKRIAPTVGDADFKMQFEEIILPFEKDIAINKQEPFTYANDWPMQHVDKMTDIYRIRADGTIFPVVIPEAGNEIYLGSFVTESDDFSVELLERTKREQYNLQSFRDIPNSGCYNDTLEKNSADLQLSTPTLLTAKTKNGSLCFWSEFKDVMTEKTTHVELEMTIMGASQDLDGLYEYGRDVQTAKPRLKGAVQRFSKPNLLNICLRERSLETCLAGAKLFAQDEKRFRITATRDMAGMLDPMVFFGVRTSGYQSVELELRDATIDLYEQVARVEVSIPSAPTQTSFDLAATDELTLSFSRDISPHSYVLDTAYEAPGYFSDLCDRYQTMRRTEQGILTFGQGCESTLFVNMPYSTQNMYLWTVDYFLGSGQYPIMIMGDEHQNYLVERASFYQGYPNIPGFHPFQDPETIFTSTQWVNTQLQSANPKQAIQMIYPQTDVASNKDHSYYFRQTTENEGLMTVSGMQIVRVPAHWASLRLTPTQGDIISYKVPQNLTFSRMLPSLWKFSYEKTEDPVMIKFSEGYDRQWGIYSSINDVLFGAPVARSTRCDGYANCFVLTEERLGGNDLFIFYVPERLAVLGWILTLGSVMGALIVSRLYRSS